MPGGLPRVGGGLRDWNVWGFGNGVEKGLTGGAEGRSIGMGRRETGVRGNFGEVSRPTAEGGWRGCGEWLWRRVAGRREDVGDELGMEKRD